MKAVETLRRYVISNFAWVRYLIYHLAPTGLSGSSFTVTVHAEPRP